MISGFIDPDAPDAKLPPPVVVKDVAAQSDGSDEDDEERDEDGEDEGEDDILETGPDPEEAQAPLCELRKLHEHTGADVEDGKRPSETKQAARAGG